MARMVEYILTKKWRKDGAAPTLAQATVRLRRVPGVVLNSEPAEGILRFRADEQTFLRVRDELRRSWNVDADRKLELQNRKMGRHGLRDRKKA